MKGFISTTLVVLQVLLTISLFLAIMMTPIFYFSKLNFNIKNVLQILITLAFLYWPLILFFTVMMFATEQAYDYPPFIFISNFILLYPLIISIVLFMTQFKVWSIAPKWILLSAIVVTFIANLSFSYPKMMFNYLRGKSNIPIQKQNT